MLKLLKAVHEFKIELTGGFAIATVLIWVAILTDSIYIIIKLILMLIK